MSLLADLQPHRIAVLRALQLGDMLCAVPALRALRRACPDARITLVGLPWAAEFAVRFSHLVDDFMALPGYPGLHEQPPASLALPAFAAAAKARQFDLAIQAHGSGEISNRALELLGAREVSGFYEEGAYCSSPGNFVRFDHGEHEVLQLLRLMKHLGAPEAGDEPELPISENEALAAQALLASRGVTAPYACIHPGARMPSRRWPAERFAAVADALAADGLRVVVTGSAGERPIARSVVMAMRAPAVELCGATSLGELGALVAGAEAVICNDTGVSHIAAAVRTPSVVIASGSDARRWAPRDATLHRVLAHEAPCRPCSYTVCPIDHPCAHGTVARDVIAEARALLGRREPAIVEAAP